MTVTISRNEYSQRVILVSGCVISAIAAAFFLLLPISIGAAANETSLTESALGLLATVYLLAFTLSGILSALSPHSLNQRIISFFGFVILASGFGMASTSLNSPNLMTTAFAVAGMGAGILYSVGFRIIGMAPTPDNIRLDSPVPYLAVRGKSNREVKADDSNRDIPLIGISLDAMKANPRGFPRYFDKETALSAILMKTLKARNLLPTKSHTVYSLRHSFEKRMLEANLDYGLRCKLMGHKNTRPEYGDGGSLEYRRTELMKIIHPYPQGVV